MITGKERRLATRGYFPAIYGSRVVWAAAPVTANDVYLFDFTTGLTRRLTTNAANQRLPAVWGTKVVYQDDRRGGLDIYCYELGSGAH